MKMIDPGMFLFILLGLLFFLTGIDHMVTGVLAIGLPPDGRFTAYALWVTGFMVFVALLGAGSAMTGRLAILQFVSVLWCWVGGSLDFIYFMMKGEIPEWNKVWTWMPGNPTTTKWGLWALGTLVAMIIAWMSVFYLPGLWGI